MKLKGNKLLPIVAVVVVAILGTIIFFVSGGNSKLKYGERDFVRGDADADQPTHTLDKLTTDVAGYKSQLKGVSEANKELSDNVEDLKNTINKLVAQNKQLNEKLLKSTAGTGEDSLNQEEKLVEIEGRIMENLQTSFDRSMREFFKSQPPGTGTKDTFKPGEEIIDEGATRIHGLDIPLDGKGNIDPEYLKYLKNSNPVKINQKEGRLPTYDLSDTKSTDVVTVPMYTIPPNSILLNAVTVTSLIGRVPISGDVAGPVPFKAMIGSENIAANGHVIPGLSGMIISGHVVGDAVLKCAYASVNSATYIFEDGRSLTLPKKEGSSKGKLGWLSDDRGNPCIPGNYETNMPKSFLARLLLGGAAGAADAYAAAETTTLSDGDVTSSVTGSSDKYVKGAAVSAAAREGANYLNSRKIDQWDAVVIPAGQTVAFHVEQEMPIDNASNLRKIDYGNSYSLVNTGLID